MRDKWVIVRWFKHCTDTVWCGAVSHLQGRQMKERRKLGLSEYGFPGGWTGELVLYDSYEEAKKDVDEGEFDNADNNFHTVELLSELKFRVTEGTYNLEDKRRIDVTGSYWECLQAIGLAALYRPLERVRLEGVE